MNSTKYRLINTLNDSVVPFESPSGLAGFILDEKLEPEQYYVIKTVITQEKYDPVHDIARLKNKRKEDKQKPDIETKAEPVEIKGEVKDDPNQKVKAKRPGLHNKVRADVVSVGL